MALQSLPASGKIKLSQIGTVFEDTGSHKMSEFYKGGSLVQASTLNNSVPTSGNPNKLSQYYSTGPVKKTVLFRSSGFETDDFDLQLNNSRVGANTNLIWVGSSRRGALAGYAPVFTGLTDAQGGNSGALAIQAGGSIQNGYRTSVNIRTWRIGNTSVVATSYTKATNTLLRITSADHGLLIGDFVSLAGLSVGGLNTNYTVDAVSEEGDTFDVVIAETAGDITGSLTYTFNTKSLDCDSISGGGFTLGMLLQIDNVVAYNSNTTASATDTDDAGIHDGDTNSFTLTTSNPGITALGHSSSSGERDPSVNNMDAGLTEHSETGSGDMFVGFSTNSSTSTTYTVTGGAHRIAAASFPI